MALVAVAVMELIPSMVIRRAGRMGRILLTTGVAVLIWRLAPEPSASRFANMVMRRMIYISHSNLKDYRAALDVLVETSSRRNAEVGISGILWSGGHEFVQALEGAHFAVGETMKRIEADPRHSDIEIICDCMVQSRMFGAWAMVRSDGDVDCTVSTAYLMGYAGRQITPAARRIVALLLDRPD